MSINHQAQISQSATIAADVEIGAFSVIGDDVTIGAGCKIAPHVVIDGPCEIGRDNTFFQFASIGSDPQDLKYQGETTILKIGDNNRFRECVTINRGTGNGGGLTQIGNNNLFMAYAHIAHDCIIGDYNIFSNNASLAGHVIVHDHVIFGGFSMVAQFITVGSYVYSDGACLMNRNVPPYIKVTDNPAKPGGINFVGLQRDGFSKEQLLVLRKMYRLFFRTEQNIKERLFLLKELAAEHDYVKFFCDYVEEKQGHKSGMLR